MTQWTNIFVWNSVDFESSTSTLTLHTAEIKRASQTYIKVDRLTCSIFCILYTIPTSFRHRFFAKIFLIKVSWTSSCLTKYCQSLFTDSATWLLDLQNKVEKIFTLCSYLYKSAVFYILIKLESEEMLKLQSYRQYTRPMWKYFNTLFLKRLHARRRGTKGRRNRTCSIFSFYLGTSEKISLRDYTMVRAAYRLFISPAHSLQYE